MKIIRILPDRTCNFLSKTRSYITTSNLPAGGYMISLKNPILSFLSFFLFFTSNLMAQDFFNTEDFHFALGANYTSLSQKRGIITNKGYLVLPLYSINLFNPDLVLAGSSLYFKQKLSDSQALRFRFQSNATGDHPLYYTTEKEEERIRREKTSELSFYYEISSEENSHLRIQYSKDLKAHKGAYVELYTHLSLFDLYTKNSKRLAQLGIFASIGGGDKKHNQYLYGGNFDSFQESNYQIGIAILSPDVIDQFWPTLKITKFGLLGEAKSGSYVDETDGISLEILLAKKLF